MPLEEFIIWVYCWTDENVVKVLGNQKLRSRGFKPALSDVEVITMEIVGEFLSHDTDKAIWEYFKTHWLSLFPKLSYRSSFAKQASNLWHVKQLLQNLLNNQSSMDAQCFIVDGFPMQTAHFKRANKSRNFKGEAGYGYCASKSETYYGFKGHLLIDDTGNITNFTLTEASGSEREAVWELAEHKKQNFLLGDKGYLSALFKEDLYNEQALKLETPVRHNMVDHLDKSERTFLNKTRRLVETVIGQLTGQFNMNKVWARKMWTLSGRLSRKILAHSLGMLANTQLKNKPLQPEYIITVQSRAWRYFHVISLFILTTRERPYMSRTTDKSAKTVTSMHALLSSRVSIPIRLPAFVTITRIATIRPATRVFCPRRLATRSASLRQ